MRQLVLTAGTLCAAAALAHWASAQNQVMPGQVVGTTLNANPVGTRFPEAAPKVMDLMEALRASVDAAKKQRPQRETPTRKPAARKKAS